MADPVVRIRRSSVSGKIPTTGQLRLGELALNTTDGKLFTERESGGVGVGTTVIALNPWNVGLGSDTYDIHFIAGSVGIGTDDPTENLDINGDVRIRGGLYDFFNNVGGNGELLTSTGAGVSWTNTATTPAGQSIVEQQASTPYYITASDVTLGVSTAGFIDTTIVAKDGSIGIGTDDPLHKIHADGQIFAGSNYTGTQYGGVRIAPNNGGGQAGGVIYGGQSAEVNSAIFLRRGFDGNLNTIDINSFGEIRFFTDGALASQTEKLRITSGGNVGINSTVPIATLDVNGTLNVSGVSTFQDNVNLGDGDRLRLGDSQDLQIYHGGSNSIIQDAGVGDLFIAGDNVVRITNSGFTETKALFTTNGSVELYYDNSKKFETTGAGVTVFGTTESQQLVVSGVSTFNDLLDINGNINIDGSQITYTSSTNELKFANNAQLRFGGGNDLRIYFDGSNSVIQDAGVGDLFLAGDNALRITDSSFTETKALFTTNGSVELYYDNSKKFETTGAGVTVFGTTESQQLNVSGVSTFNSDVRITSTGNLILDASGPQSVIFKDGGSDGLQFSYFTTGDFLNLQRSSDSSKVLRANRDSANIELYYNNSKKLETTGAGVTVFGTTESQQLVVSGVSTFQSHVYLGDSDNLYFGDGEDMRILHNGTDSFIIDQGVGNLNIYGDNEVRIRNTAGNEYKARFITNGAVELYYDNSKKFETTGFGATIFGRLDVDELDIGTGVAVTTILDEDNMVSDSDTALATQQSIKAYVDNQLSGANLDFTGDTGSGSIVLDTETFDISGTLNEIETVGSGNTITIGLPNDVTIGQDLTVTRDVNILRNLDVTGNITVGGTSATIFTQTLEVEDPDIVLGIRTDGSGNDVSTDNTANHGGIAIASTEGNPLVNLNIAGIETLPPTYKKIMWFKSGSFAGLATDAWLTNYAFGIGTTSMSNGTRLAVGNIEFNDDDITSITNINATGIITASSFSGNGASLTNVDAETLDGFDSDQFLRSDVGDIKTAGNLIFNDTISLRFGTDQDLDIYHDGSNSYISQDGTGDLYIRNTTDDRDVIIQSDDGAGGTATYIRADGSSGEVQLSYYNSQRLRTTATGIDVAGTTDTDQLNVSGVSTFVGDISIADKIIHTGDTNTAIRFPANDTFTVETAGSERLRVTSQGRVGIGTNPNSNATLDIKGAGASVIRLNAAANASYTDLRHNQTGKYFEVTPSSTSNQSFIVNKPNGDEALRITSAGDVGIGTNNPGANLDIAETGFVNVKIRTTGNNSATLNLQNSQRNFSVNNVSAGALTIYDSTANEERFRITSAGDVGIGTDNPSQKLQISSTTHPLVIDDNSANVDQGIVFTTAGDANYRAAIRLTPGGSTKGLRFMTGGYVNNTERLRITDIGRVGINTDAPSQTLDVNGNVRFRNALYDNTNSDGDPNQILSSTGSGIAWITPSSSASGTEILSQQASTPYYITASDVTSGVSTAGFIDTTIVAKDGNIGIGTDNPTALLNVYGEVSPYILVEDGNPAENQARINFKTPSYEWTTGVHGGDSGKYKVSYASAHGGNDYLTILTSGDVGIGTDNPTNTLEISKEANHGIILTRPAGGTNPGTVKFEVHSNGSGRLISERDFNLNFDTDNIGNQQFNVSSNGTERFRITSAGDVGIGTDNPGDKLHVSTASFGGALIERTTAGGGVKLDLKNGNGNVRNIVNDSSGILQLQYNSSNQVVVNQSGDVGIGTDNPVVALEIGRPKSVNQIRLNPSDGNVDLRVNSSFGSADLASVSVASNHPLAFHTNNAERIRITNVGRVGINTDAPTAKLDVNGDVSIASTVSIGTTIDIVPYNNLGTLSFEGSAGQLFSITNNLTSGSIFAVNDVSGIPSIDVDADGTIQLAPFGASEYVGIGLTNPTQKLDVNGDVRFRGAIYDNNNVVGTANSILTSTGSGVVWADSSTIPVGDAQTLDGLDSTQFLRSDVADTKTGITTFSDDLVIADKISHEGDTDTAIRFPATDTFTVETAGSERLRVTSGGRVGIGSAIPAATLDLLSSTTKIQLSPNGTDKAVIHDGNRGDLILSADDSGTNGASSIQFKVDGSERVRITSDGDVGIGTDNLTAKFTVYSTISDVNTREIRIDASDAPAGSTAAGLFRILGDQNANGKYLIGYNTNHPTQANELSLKNADGDITFNNANDGTPTEKVRITSGGDVGINTDAPSQTLDVNGNARFRGAIYDNNNVVGVANSILTSTGSGVVWADITTIPVGDAQTLDGLDSTQFLRSDVDDTKTGITTFTGDAYFGGQIYITDTFGGYEQIEIASNDLRVDNKHLHSAFGVWCRSSINGDRSTGMDAVSDELRLYSNSVEQVRIDTTGQVGIGTDDPTEKLDVRGNIAVNETTVTGSATASLSTLIQTSIHTLSTATYRSVEYTIQATQGTNFHATKILALHNGTTAYHSEYGTIFNNSSVAAFDVDISGGNIRLLATSAVALQTDYVINFVATKL